MKGCLKNTTALPEPLGPPVRPDWAQSEPAFSKDQVNEPASLRGYPTIEARQRLGGMSHTKFHELIRDGHLRVIHIGSRIVVPEAEIARILRDGVPGRGKRKEVAVG